MNIEYPDEEIIVTDAGRFHLKLTKNKNRNTGEIQTYTISLGSPTNKCVQLTIPTYDNTVNRNGYLLWVKSDESCSMEKYIEKGFVQHMVNLAITIARDINPSLERINFDDDSGFMCSLPDHTRAKVSMREFHIAFHGASWYEYYFDAKLVKDHKIYLEKKGNMDIKKYKPESFNFVNEELQEILDPIYASTDTWREFFQAIQEKFGNKKCAVIYPWIRNALYNIFESPIFMDPKWVIELEEYDMKNKNEIKDKKRKINFKSYEVTRRGGLRGGNTRKKSKGRMVYSPGVFDHIPQHQLTRMKYRRFLKN